MLHKLKLIGYFIITLSLVLNLEAGLASDRTIGYERSSEVRQLLQEGIELYERGAFNSAKDVWLRSASLATRQQVLEAALSWNNLALAHQQLGEWSESQTAIAKSLNLLDSQDLTDIPGYWSILAKVTNTQGNWQLRTNNTELALASWQNAAGYYQRAGEPTKAIEVQINRAKALQSIGFAAKAVAILEEVNGSLQQVSDPQLKASGLRNLGIGLRNLGELEPAVDVLRQSLNLARQDSSKTWLELGNTYRQQSDRARSIGKETLAQEYFESAIQAYKTAAKSESSFLQARLNQLSLLVEADRYAEARTLLAEINFPTRLEPSRTNVYALLNYAHSLTCLRSPDAADFCSNEINPSFNQSRSFSEAIEAIERGITIAKEIQDPLAEALALSQLARVYELQGNYQKAKDLNQQALFLLEGKSVPDIAYRLEWQLGRIFRQQDNLTAATLAYSQAIASVERVRDNILLIDPQVQFSFRDRVEPVYRQYVDLLLTTDDTAPSQANLHQAIATVDALQRGELENFLGCDLSQLVKLDETTVDVAAAQIYPIILDQRIVTIVEIPEQPLIYREVKVPRSRVEATLTALQDNLIQPGKTPEVLEYGQQVYQWLIEPLESILSANSQIKTLVFLPDGLLRNIPLAALYDGEEYFIEKGYAFAVSPRLELFAPSPSTTPLKVAIGGVEISQTIKGIEFPEIAQVKQELTQIAREVKTNSPLLNDAFTQANIEQQFQQGNFSAIHWKTHGVFSSDPTATFLVAYQDSINANELQSLIQTASRNGQEPLELLILSACETAKGDSKAILGLAGLTVKTGARTAISSFWRANDRATTLLMTKFYQQLELGTGKAEALRQAQLYLLKEEGYFAPHYWGTYVAIGNWL